MADNVSVAVPSTGTLKTVLADEVNDATLGTGVAQFVKIMGGDLDSTNKLTVTAAGAMKTDPSGVTSPVSVASLPLPSGAATDATLTTLQTLLTTISGLVSTLGSATGMKVNLVNSSGTEIDTTTAGPVTQSGTWTVQPGNTANTTAWKVDGSAVTQPVSISSVAFDVATTITRPANTTAYTAGDVLGGALDLGVLGPSGAAVMITSVQLEADIAAIPSGQTTWSLHLYNVTPPSATADNGAWDLPSGDRASYLGQITLTTLIDQGSTLYMESNGINKQLKLSGTHLFGYLVTVGGFTPAANSEVYKVTVHTVSL